jgi:hypothetical protein
VRRLPPSGITGLASTSESLKRPEIYFETMATCQVAMAPESKTAVAGPEAADRPAHPSSLALRPGAK